MWSPRFWNWWVEIRNRIDNLRILQKNETAKLEFADLGSHGVDGHTQICERKQGVREQSLLQSFSKE